MIKFTRAIHRTPVLNMACVGACECDRTPFTARPDVQQRGGYFYLKVRNVQGRKCIYIHIFFYKQEKKTFKSPLCLYFLLFISIVLLFFLLFFNQIFSLITLIDSILIIKNECIVYIHTCHKLELSLIVIKL